MKFLACSRCFSNSEKPASRQPVQEITNPLVMTKRPIPKLNARKAESKASNGRNRFPALLNALSSWSRRQPPKKSSAPRNVRKTVRVIEPTQRRRSRRPQTRTQRLIRMYEERASSPDVRGDMVIKPPPSFDDDDGSLESHQNFKNKLNTLDFKRMNTVALEEPSPSTSRAESIYRKNSYVEPEPSCMPVAKFAKKTLLEDYLKERAKIEQAMIDLLNGEDPGSVILRKSRNEDKKVRFRVENENERELRVDLTGERKTGLTDDGRVEQETEIKLRVDPMTKVEDFYVERKTTFFKDKTVEDKALVVKIGKRNRRYVKEDQIGRTVSRNLVFRNFGKMSL